MTWRTFRLYLQLATFSTKFNIKKLLKNKVKRIKKYKNNNRLLYILKLHIYKKQQFH